MNLARRLHANGVPLRVDDTWQQSVLHFRQIGGSSESRGFDLGDDSTGSIIDANIYVDSNNIPISNAYLKPFWDDPSISLLTDPIEIEKHHSNYRFYGKSPFEIERTRVLNHEGRGNSQASF